MTTEVHEFKLKSEAQVKRDLSFYFNRVRENVRKFYVRGELVYDPTNLTNKEDDKLLEVILSLFYFEILVGISGQATMGFQVRLDDPFEKIQGQILQNTNNYSLARVMGVLDGIQNTIRTTINDTLIDTITAHLNDNGILQQQFFNNSYQPNGFYVSSLVAANNIRASTREERLEDGEETAAGISESTIIDNENDINLKDKNPVNQAAALAALVVLNQRINKALIADEVDDKLERQFAIIMDRLAMTETQVTTEEFRADEVIATSEITEAVGISANIKKKWRAILDSRVRPWHLDADGQTQPLSEPFLVHGELLNRPGDTSLGASLNNIINCRCEAVYTLD